MKIKLLVFKPKKLVRTFILVLLAVFTVVPLAAAAGEEAILILDASGSMWGQIENEPKIAIAKRVVNGLLVDLPTDHQLGLFAYGHNRKGDCKDIEEIAAVGAERATIKAAVSRLNPKGKTPMTTAVKMAAGKLRYTEDKATVVLISDGIETCAPDPCSAASALEQAGVDFTAHVIGFDVQEENEQAQLRCIAENTGGKFISVDNAEDLGEALQSTVVAAPAVVESNLYLRATELKGGKVIETGLSWTITPSESTSDAVIHKTGTGSIEETVAPGTYDIAVARPSDGLKGSARMVEIAPNGAKTITVPLEFTLQATLVVEPQRVGSAGADISVAFTGPEREGDYISIAEKGESASHYKAYRYVKAGNPVKLRLPVEPGDYEVRYVLGQPYRVLARLDHTVNAAAATLSAPDSASSGTTIPVEFTGPADSGDFITITKPAAGAQSYSSYAYTRNGSPGEIKMPLKPGEYELRFVQGNTKVLARRAINVTAAVATLTAPASASIGESIKVDFTGPTESGSFITVTAPDAREADYGDYAYTKTGSPAALRMPEVAGEYEIRYVQGNKKILARQPIQVTPIR